MPTESTIRAIHAGLSEATLEALANRGLLRRAGRDQERGAVRELGFDGAVLRLAVDDRTVRLNEAGPARAVCDCPSAGVCQHVLAACLHLMRAPVAAPEPGPERDPRAAWLALPEDELRKSFDPPALRRAREIVDQTPAVITLDRGLVVRFPDWNGEVRAVEGAGIEGLVVSGGSEKQREALAAAAVLAVWREGGRDWTPPAPASAARRLAVAAEATPLPASARALAEECVAAGLARLSPALRERLRGLSVAAAAGGMHRLSLVAERVARLASDWERRLPHADLASVFGELARLHALAEAAAGPAGPRLAGPARGGYAGVGTLDLHGVTGWPWRTASGYEGLTLLAWDSRGRQWNTWTEARPTAFRRDFSATARWQAPGPWEGAACPAELANRSFRLLHAKRGRWGRLSSSGQTHALVGSPVDRLATGPTAHEDWVELAAELASATPPGLDETDPRAQLRVLRPTTWIRSPFNPVAQRLEWVLGDARGRTLYLRVPFDDLHTPVLRALEGLPDDGLRDARLCARCETREEGVVVYPLCLWSAKGAVHLFFPAPVTKPLAAVAPPPSGEPDDEEETGPDGNPEPEPALPSAASALGRVVLELLSHLEERAESGCLARPRSGSSRDRLDAVRSLGWTPLAVLLERLESRPTPRLLLQLRWIVGVLARVQG